MTYKIVRRLFIGGHRVIKTGLTLERALEHCRSKLFVAQPHV
jgi:hypothetical protein